MMKTKMMLVKAKLMAGKSHARKRVYAGSIQNEACPRKQRLRQIATAAPALIMVVIRNMI